MPEHLRPYIPSISSLQTAAMAACHRFAWPPRLARDALRSSLFGESSRPPVQKHCDSRLAQRQTMASPLSGRLFDSIFSAPTRTTCGRHSAGVYMPRRWDGRLRCTGGAWTRQAHTQAGSASPPIPASDHSHIPVPHKVGPSRRVKLLQSRLWKPPKAARDSLRTLPIRLDEHLESRRARRRHVRLLQLLKKTQLGSHPPLVNQSPAARWRSFTQHILGGQRSEGPIRALVVGFAAIWLVIFLLWCTAIDKRRRGFGPDAQLWMMENFTGGLQQLREGRYWTAFTYAFSHKDLGHFAMNMLPFLAFGFVTAHVFPSQASFCMFYLGAAITSLCASMAWHEYRKPDKNAQHSLIGASGCVYGLAAIANSLRAPRNLRFLILPPRLGWLSVPILLGIECTHTYFGWEGWGDGPGHIGGLLYGLTYYYVCLRGKKRAPWGRIGPRGRKFH